jgi:ATP-grasp domain-containing protein
VHILYPGDPLRSLNCDEFYAAEFGAIQAAGFSESTFSFEEFQSGSFRAFPSLPAGSEVIYRGWMLSAGEYENLVTAVASAGAHLLTDARAYLSTHHLPNWYPLISEFTPETRIFPANADLVAELQSLSWSEYFIKDYVKSLKTSVGSRISTPEQAAIVVTEMRKFRGSIEGGICVRKVEEFLHETEERYFVVDGEVCSMSGEVPAIVMNCAERIRSRFFSVDVVKRADDVLRVVEIGDGQVSDLVGWTPIRFAEMLSKFFRKNKCKSLN